MRTKKKQLIWAGVLNFALAALLIYTVVAIAFNIDGVADYTIALIESSYGFEVADNMLTTIYIYMIANVVADIAFGIVYIVFAHFSLEKFIKRRTLLLVITFINVVVGTSIITLILVLCAAFSEPKQNVPQTFKDLDEQYNNVNNTTTINDSEKFYAVSEKITNLKQRYNSKKITEEEYKAELIKIMDEANK
jgi:hypothetical protein